ncbi:MAG: NADH-quinone oxidoreductase subunit C [Actinomycetota bacterium]|nr:NADH-quinone oxidoreductase subunit C [Actinomycetota bacterium]
MTETIPAGAWRERAQSLKDEGWWLVSLCGLDRLRLPGTGDDRFHVVVHFLHTERKERVRIHVAAEGDPPTVPTITDLFPTGVFMEREAYDLFGIHFDGHVDLHRILMPDEWEGHPLRKDYGVGKVAIDFLPQPLVQIDAPRQSPKPPEADAEVDRLGQFANQGGELP